MLTRDQTNEKNPNYRHGGSKLPEHRHWVGMKQRCRRDPHYIAHGITVCAEWANDFAKFYAEIGPKPFPRATVDRIDGNLGYVPGNVRWASYKEQSRNLVYRSGARKPRADLAEKLGVHINTLRYREKMGLPLDTPTWGAHTFCKKGHDYTEANTYVTPKNVRKCRICRNAAQRRYNAKAKELKGLNPKRNEM